MQKIKNEIINKIYKEILDNFELWQIDAFLDLLYNKEFEKMTNKELLQEAIKNLIEEWEENKELYHNELGDFIHEWADNRIEIYTTAIFDWYSKNAYRSSYADDFINELGSSGDIIKDLQGGMYKCLEEFAFFVLEQYNELKGGDDEDE